MNAFQILPWQQDGVETFNIKHNLSFDNNPLRETTLLNQTLQSAFHFNNLIYMFAYLQLTSKLPEPGGQRLTSPTFRVTSLATLKLLSSLILATAS